MVFVLDKTTFEFLSLKKPKRNIFFIFIWINKTHGSFVILKNS